MADGKTKIKAFVVFLLFLLLLIIIRAIDFSPVDLSPNNATTQSILICEWTDGVTEVNVTWYNNSVQYGNMIPNATYPQIISSALTQRGEVWNCTVVEWNDSTNILSDKVTIENANPTPPSLSNSQLTLYEDTPWSSDLLSTDPDGDTVYFFCLPTELLDTCTLDGEISWTPLSSDVEPNPSIVYNMTFYAYDEYDGTASRRISLNVTAVNDRPNLTLPKLLNHSISESEKLQYPVTVADEENITGPFLFFVNSSYAAPERINYSTSNNITFIIMFEGNRTAEIGDIGNKTIMVRACDPVDHSLCIDDNFTLEVTSLNHAPNITYIEETAGNYTEGENFTLMFNATDIDSADTLNFTIASPCGIMLPWVIDIINNSANAVAILNASPLNDSHIRCKNITIYATDGMAESLPINLLLNITNQNDIPFIHQINMNSSNTHSNRNISNLTAYADLIFRYIINATDEDLTYGVDPLESLIYTINSSNCPDCPHLTLNSTTGEIVFMPNSSFTGVFSYEINITDRYNANDTAVLVITVLNNSPPYFNQTLPNLTLYENIYFNITLNATDPEGQFDSFSDNSSLFIINRTTGFFELTPVCSNVGNRSVKITINDTLGRENESSFSLEIIMTPDTPEMSVLENATLVEEIPYYLNLSTTTRDEDSDCGQPDSMTFNSSFIFGNTLFNITETGIISFTPNTTADGNYLVNISVLDTYGLSSSLLWNITVVNRTSPPEIHNVTPYGYPFNTGWIDLSDLGVDYTTLNVSEGTEVSYNHNSTDPDENPLEFNWTIDGGYSANTSSLDLTWNYTSSGIHNVTLSVFDIVNGTRAHKTSFSWITQVRELNRIPEIWNNLSDVNVTGAITIGNYLVCGNYVGGSCDEVRFYDPDGDTLVYGHSDSSILDISINGDSVTFTGIEVGEDVIFFTASDSQGTAYSNNLTVWVISVPEQEAATSDSSSSRGSSSGSSSPYYIFQEVEKLKDQFLDILVPEPITLYKNNTLREKIKIVNKGNETLRGIVLSAKTNHTEADISFSKFYFSELEPGQTETTEIVITAYKLLNHYEIVVFANVTNPRYTDKAVIFVNALERTKGNQSLAATKITFTEDLLSSNPECIELNEFIKKAQDHMENGDYEEASIILDSVIQGCKYLVSQSKLHSEKPELLRFPIDINGNPYIKPALIIFVLFVAIAIALTMRLKRLNEKDS